MNLSYFQDYHKKVIDNCSKVIVGKEDVISLVLTCFVCSFRHISNFKNKDRVEESYISIFFMVNR